MYKDKDKQREANAERQRRYKAKHKGVTSAGVTDKALPKDRDVCMFLPKKVPKRGKDIRCFADLSPGIQQVINRLSTIDGKIDKSRKVNRTIIAINYQHLFPDRYYPQDAVCSGVVTGKPGDADYDGVLS